jgi:hypothetical protein
MLDRGFLKFMPLPVAADMRPLHHAERTALEHPAHILQPSAHTALYERQLQGPSSSAQK